MKITNKLNLPEPLLNAIQSSSYKGDGADISVTSLLSPPRAVALTKQHYDELTEDASDRIWSLLGQTMHSILEKANATGISERRLTTEIEGWQVSGGMDIYFEGGELWDYKLTNTAKIKDNQPPNEFVQQLNCYAELLRAHNYPVTKLKLLVVFRDWSKAYSLREPSYPQKNVAVVDVPLWPQSQAQAFLRERVILHKQARVSLPLCTSEERWQTPDQFAVMKAGAKRALRLLTSKQEAEELAKTSGADVQVRPGSSIRCGYCSAKNFCEQAKNIANRTTQEENSA